VRKIADIWSQTLSPNHFRRARYNAQFSSVSFLKILTQLFVPSKDLEGNSLIITNVTSKRITQNREMSIKSPDCRSKKKKNELYFIYSYLFTITLTLMTCTYFYRINTAIDIWNQDALLSE
jgi:hypothetical protein